MVHDAVGRTGACRSVGGAATASARRGCAGPAQPRSPRRRPLVLLVVDVEVVLPRHRQQPSATSVTAAPSAQPRNLRLMTRSERHDDGSGPGVRRHLVAVARGQRRVSRVVITTQLSPLLRSTRTTPLPLPSGSPGPATSAAPDTPVRRTVVGPAVAVAVAARRRERRRRQQVLSRRLGARAARTSPAAATSRHSEQLQRQTITPGSCRRTGCSDLGRRR